VRMMQKKKNTLVDHSISWKPYSPCYHSHILSISFPIILRKSSSSLEHL
jgi:predicted mannosyl-3-phosphoglycerate phosphatase (HAD superfamily)